MGKTLFDKIWQRHLVRDETDQFPAVLYVDLHLIHEVTSPQAFAELEQKGLTVIPIRIYEKGNLLKAEIAVARGKKLHDKRKTLKDRTSKREAERAMKGL